MVRAYYRSAPILFRLERQFLTVQGGQTLVERASSLRRNREPLPIGARESPAAGLVPNIEDG